MNRYAYQIQTQRGWTAQRGSFATVIEAHHVATTSALYDGNPDHIRVTIAR